MTARDPDEIRYEPVPGYRRAFHLILAAACAYLAFVFLRVGIR
jgi:hypothetical protein